MARVYIFSSDASISVDLGLSIIVSSRSVHDYEVTEHTVESGVAITDHMRQKPDRLDLETFVTNQPIDDPDMVLTQVPLTVPDYPAGDVVSRLVDAITGPSAPRQYSASLWQFPADKDFDYVVSAIENLKQLQASGARVDVFLPKESHFDMVLASFEVSKGADDGDGASIKLTFKQVRIAETHLTRAPAPSVVVGQPQANKGSQTAAPLDPKKSAAVKLGVPGVVRPPV